MLQGVLCITGLHARPNASTCRAHRQDKGGLGWPHSANLIGPQQPSMQQEEPYQAMKKKNHWQDSFASLSRGSQTRSPKQVSLILPDHVWNRGVAPRLSTFPFGAPCWAPLGWSPGSQGAVHRCIGGLQAVTIFVCLEPMG